MITIDFDAVEGFNEETLEFYDVLPPKTFRFEHSLLAISKWEMKYEVNMIGNENLTNQQTLDYMTMMCMDKGFDVRYFTPQTIKQLEAYMKKKNTATKVYHKNNGSNSKQTLTSELIYAYMALAQVPFKCETWNINRLMNLIDCIGVLNNGHKNKKGGHDTAKRYSKLNAQRLAKYNTKG